MPFSTILHWITSKVCWSNFWLWPICHCSCCFVRVQGQYILFMSLFLANPPNSLFMNENKRLWDFKTNLQEFREFCLKKSSLDPGFSVCSPFMNLDDLGLHLHLLGCTSSFWPFLPLVAYQSVSLVQHAYLRHLQDQTSSWIPEKRKLNSSCNSVGMIRYDKIHGHIKRKCANGHKLGMKKGCGDIHKRYLCK